MAVLYGSMVIVYTWFGGMKFTAYEALGLVDLVSNSPILGWAYEAFSVRQFSTVLGVLEICIAALIAGRLISPTLSLVGGLLSMGLFATTLTLMASTPGVFEPGLGFPAISVAPGQFLLKDVALLAVSLWIAVDSLRAHRALAFPGLREGLRLHASWPAGLTWKRVAPPAAANSPRRRTSQRQP